MHIASLLPPPESNPNKPTVSVLLESDFTKEIRIFFRKGQIMKEHQTTFPITVEVFDGAIDFGVEGQVFHLTRGDLISLSPNIPHDLTATTTSTVRLSLSKQDSVQRVIEVAK